MEAHGAPYELHLQVTALKESLDEKEKALEDVRTSLTNSEAGKVTLTSQVVEVKGALKQEEKDKVKEKKEKMKAYVMIV